MRNPVLLKALFAIISLAAVVGCSNEDPTEPPVTTPEVTPKVTVEIGEVTTSTIQFTIAPTDAESVKWMLVEGDNAPEASVVKSEGVEVAATESTTHVCEDLNPETKYVVAVVATNGEKQAFAFKTTTTLKQEIPLPTVTVSLREGSVGEKSLSFFITSTEAEVLKWVCIEDGSRDVTAQQVLSNGKSVDPNVESEVVVEGLKSNTAYAIYAAATVDIEGFTPVMSEKLVMVTSEPEPVEYILSESTTASASIRTSSLDNYFIIFADEANGYTLRCDFYTATGSTHLPSAEYPLGDMAEGSLCKLYTSFMFSAMDSEMTLFDNGALTVEATPNEETLEVIYAISGTLYFANGDYVTVNYNGKIDGIALPEPKPEDPDTPEMPEGAYLFEADVETKTPERIHGNSLVAGEYYLKFYTSNWDELALDLMLDPAICNDGKDALPAGTYTMADGTIDGYSNVTLYSPYFGERFSEAELTVKVNGEEYEFIFLGVAGSGSTAKTIFMHYVGEITDMVRN